MPFKPVARTENIEPSSGEKKGKRAVFDDSRRGMNGVDVYGPLWPGRVVASRDVLFSEPEDLVERVFNGIILASHHHPEQTIDIHVLEQLGKMLCHAFAHHEPAQQPRRAP